QVIEDLDPRPDNHYIVKHRYTAFFNTDLDLTLRDHQVNTLVIFGVVTNICVRSTVHDAFFLGYQVVVPEDCVAATGPREQESSLYDIGTHFGIVADSEQVTGALLRSAPLENRIAAGRRFRPCGTTGLPTERSPRPAAACCRPPPA